MKTYAPLTFQVRWGNPYTEPPNGEPRVLISVKQLGPNRSEIPTEVKAVCERVGFGSGWNLSVAVDPADRPHREFAPETKARLRRNNLVKRIEKLAPLFADQIVAKEMSERPEYFAGAEVTR